MKWGRLSLLSKNRKKKIRSVVYHNKEEFDSIIDAWRKKRKKYFYIHVLPFIKEEQAPVIMNMPTPREKKEIKKEKVRPPSTYSNTTPFGIAKEV